MPASQLYLVLEANGSAETHVDAALRAGPVAAILFVPAEGQALTGEALRPLALRAQKQGVAVMVPDDVALAKAVGADGIHVSQGPDVVERAAAIHEQVGPRLMIGASAGTSRHIAMELGELGLDYVAFEARRGTDPEEARETRLDLCSWWAEIFEVPCVAWQVADADEAQEHAAAGVEFISYRLPTEQRPLETERSLRSMTLALCSAAPEGSGT